MSVRTGAASDGLQMRPYLFYFDYMQVDSKEVCIVLIIKSSKCQQKLKCNKNKMLILIIKAIKYLDACHDAHH